MACTRRNSWGDPIPFPQSPTAGQEYPAPSHHAEMSWTVCYDDDCGVHLHEKQGAGWFPMKRKKKASKNSKRKGVKKDRDEDDPETRPWGDSGDGGGCPIPTDEEVKVIMARKAAREAVAAAIGTVEEVTTEVQTDWVEKSGKSSIGGTVVDGSAGLNTSKHIPPAEVVLKPAFSAKGPTITQVGYKPRRGNLQGKLPFPDHKYHRAGGHLPKSKSPNQQGPRQDKPAPKPTQVGPPTSSC
ncbi:hypothetical protein L873DRAFT_1845938 [Choiromyces venosus 120613-1]|uniref:Uncharacterized protein n=1 Tax=Choiromyces venosus 120613-1 TaxID=1336337 RepID=A0A3N4JFJ4_9PEZI|nr:hypothetical protein L873DRAFT_1845938 [Choiromyces venosus 120613-1]